MADRGTSCDCSEILKDFLYLGGSQTARNLEALKRLKITHILSLVGKEHYPGEDSSEWVWFTQACSWSPSVSWGCGSSKGKGVCSLLRWSEHRALLPDEDQGMVVAGSLPTCQSHSTRYPIQCRLSQTTPQLRTRTLWNNQWERRLSNSNMDPSVM